MLTREQLIREYQNRSATLPAFLIVYGLIVAAMVGSAMAIT